MTVAATNMPPTERDRHGKTPCAQGARRDPEAAEPKRGSEATKPWEKERPRGPRDAAEHEPAGIEESFMRVRTGASL